MKIVEVLNRYDGKFNGITSRWKLKYEQQLLIDLESIGYMLESLENEEFTNKIRKINVIIQIF